MEISRTLYSGAHTAYEATYTPGIVFAHRETGGLKAVRKFVKAYGSRS